MDLTKDQISQRCSQHGYRGIPTAEQVFRECATLEKEGEYMEPLLELAVILEQREARMVAHKKGV